MFISLAAFAAAGLAHAQATRTWVSGVGDDANPCSRTAPCKTFAGAISKTAAHGEINVLDPGGFGAVTITKSISIVAEGATAGVLVSGTNGIIVNLPATTDNVLLQGLDIEGVGTGLSGIRMIGPGDLVVKDCDIRGFRGAGAGFGIDIQSSTGARVLVQDSTIVGNTGGINARSTLVTGSVIVTNTVIDKNDSFGIKAENAQSAVFLDDSVVAGQPNVLQTANGGTITSCGNNVLRIGAPSATTPLQ
jgi:hypothetical protein